MMKYTVHKGGGGRVTNGETACAWIMLRTISGAVCAEVISPDEQQKEPSFHFPPLKSGAAADHLPEHVFKVDENVT